MKAGRSDLIGYDKKCLIRPKRESDKYTHINGQTKGGKTYSKNNRSKKDGTVKSKKRRTTIRNPSLCNDIPRFYLLL